MQQTFFLSKYSGWKELPATLIYPINATYGIDGGTDTMELSFYAPQNFDLPLDTPIKVQHDDDIRYFVVKDCKFSDMQYVNLTTRKPERLFTISLCEPFELLRGYKLQACKFSPNRYTVSECLKRMFFLANFNGSIDIPKPNNIIRNVLEFSSTTLYLGIYEIARTQDCIPYLDFDEEYLKWIVKFQPLNGLNERQYDGNILTNPIIQKQNLGEGIAKKVYIEATNLKNIKTKKVSNVIAIATDGSNTITINNFGLKLGNNIDNLESINVMTEDSYLWYFKNNGILDYVALFEGAYYEETRTIKLLSKVNYDNLTTREKEDKNVIYIFYEDNIVYMHDLIKLAPRNIAVTLPSGQVWNDPTFALQKVKGDATGYIGRIHNIVTPIWQQNYLVYAQTTTTQTIPFIAYNNNEYDDTTFYNQNAKAVDPISMERVLQTYIDNMQSGTLLRTGIFNHYADIPQEGSIIVIDNKNYIVNSLTIADNARYYDVTFALVENHAKRREYMEANTNIQIEDITSAELIPSFNLKPYLIKYSMLDEIEQKTNVDIKQHEGIVCPRNDGQQLYNSKMYLYFNRTGISAGLSFRSNIDYVTYNNSISFYATAENNFIWNDAVDSNGNLLPQTYANKNGEVIDMTVELETDNGQILSKFSFDGDSTMPLKDRMEILTITNQYTYKGVNETLVANDFINWLLNANQFTRVRVYSYNQHIGQYDDKPTDYVDYTEASVIVNSTTQRITLSLDRILTGEYKSIVITELGGTQMLFIKNYYDYRDAVADYLPIYYSIEDGLPVQTSVRPYDYED
jgi:hypothetical protein